MPTLISRGSGCILYWLLMAIQLDRSFPWADMRPEAMVRPEATATVLVMMLAGAVIGGICFSMAAEALMRAVCEKRATTWYEDEAIVTWAAVTAMLIVCLLMFDNGVTGGRGLGFALLAGTTVAVVISFWAMQPTTDEVYRPHRMIALPR